MASLSEACMSQHSCPAFRGLKNEQGIPQSTWGRERKYPFSSESWTCYGQLWLLEWRPSIIPVRWTCATYSQPCFRCLHLAYTAQILVLLPWRIYTYKRKHWHYFLFDVRLHLSVGKIGFNPIIALLFLSNHLFNIYLGRALESITLLSLILPLTWLSRQRRDNMAQQSCLSWPR